MEFRLPELGEGDYEAELVGWLVKSGDPVKRGQNLMEVMTDKATMEVPSPFAGQITAFQAEPGQQIKVGDVVLTYSGSTSAEEKTEQRPDKKSAKKKTASNDEDMEKSAAGSPPSTNLSQATQSRPMGNGPSENTRAGLMV